MDFFKNNYIFLVLFVFAFAITALAYDKVGNSTFNSSKDSIKSEEKVTESQQGPCTEDCENSCESNTCPDNENTSTNNSKDKSSSGTLNSPAGSQRIDTSTNTAQGKNTGPEESQQPNETTNAPAGGCPVVDGNDSCPSY